MGVGPSRLRSNDLAVDPAKEPKHERFSRLALPTFTLVSLLGQISLWIRPPRLITDSPWSNILLASTQFQILWHPLGEETGWCRRQRGRFWEREKASLLPFPHSILWSVKWTSRAFLYRRFAFFFSFSPMPIYEWLNG